MSHQYMHLLRTGCHPDRNCQTDVTDLRHFTAAFCRHADTGNALCLCLFNGQQNIFAVSGGGNADKHIPPFAQSLHLAGWKRPTNSAARCWLSAALPPLPQNKTLCPPDRAFPTHKAHFSSFWGRSEAFNLCSASKCSVKRCSIIRFTGPPLFHVS